MSKPELIAGKWVERRRYVGGTNACGRCAFGTQECRTTRHEGRTIRSLCDGIYFLRVKEPEPMPYPEPARVMPTEAPMAPEPVAQQGTPAPESAQVPHRVRYTLDQVRRMEDELADLTTALELTAPGNDWQLGLEYRAYPGEDNACVTLELENDTGNVREKFSFALYQVLKNLEDELLLRATERLREDITALQKSISDDLLTLAVEYRK